MMVLRNHDALSRRRMAAMQDPVTGVYQYGQRFQGVRNAPLPCFRYATARLTGFEKMLGRTDETLTYHLCGYGLTPGESLVSLVGETAERFSYVASQALLGDRVVRASYADLVRDCEANGDRLCPLSLVNVVYDPGTPHWVEETDELTWLRMTSASDTSRCVLIPLQMVLPYSSGLFADEPRILPSAVSTGTACHETFEHALENCLIVPAFVLGHVVVDGLAGLRKIFLAVVACGAFVLAGLPGAVILHVLFNLLVFLRKFADAADLSARRLM